ncbi:MAG: hypothetical protein RLY71_795 [Pseudomonadota bacterium]|jgi:peptidyl-prolyl cis-trans isomerase D
MFEFVRRHNRWLQFALMLLIFPSFVVFGIQGYQRFNEGNGEVATVDGSKISQAEWDNAHRNQVERMRQQMPNVDVKLLDTPEARQRVLADLVRARVEQQAASKLHLQPSDEYLARVFRDDPQFASLRNPDGTVRKELLTLRGMSSQQFAEQLRQDIAVRQVFGGLTGSAFAPAGIASTALDAMFQQREVRIARFEAKDYLAKVQAADADLQAWYDDPKHAAQFQSPETASVEYVVLDMATVEKSISVPLDDLRKYYEQNAARYTQPQERQARHILIKLDGNATDAAKTAARAKAEQILAELKKNPATFAELAKKNSDDPGSAVQGGDLGWFGRGAMTQAFEDAVFGLKKGELSGIVTSEFGLHIIQLTDVRGGEQRSFDSVKGELEEEVRKQLAQKRFAEVAEQFTDAVDQEANLQAVATKLKLTPQQAPQLSRTPAPGATGALANPKLLAAIFDSNNLSRKENLQALEIGPNQLASARILSYSPTRKLPLDEVREQVRSAVLADKAAAAARTEGEQRLKEWQADPAKATALAAPVVLSRSQAQNQPRALIDAMLRAKATALPGWAGVDLGSQGYAIVKIDKVLPADAKAMGGIERIQAQYAQLWAQAETEAYYAALSQRYKAKINAKPSASAPAN